MVPPSTRLGRLKLTLFSVAVGMLFGEVLTRAAIEFLPPSLLSDPSSYADPRCDDAYWRLLDDVAPSEHLVSQRSPESRGSPLTQDTRMGWAIRPDHLNGLGAWKSPPVWSSSAPRLGVFGDSFVQWYHPDGQHLADHLQDQLPELQVLGYGVGGYGLDQIVLSMEAQLPQLEGGHAVLGIMIMDLDRAILHFRHGPKPWFSLEDGTLTLHSAQFGDADARRAGPRSTFLALLKHGVWQQIRARLGWPPSECRVAEKTALTRALITRAADACVESEVRCTLVLFPDRTAYQATPGWRSLAISQEAQSQGLALVDAGQVWTEAGLGPNQVFAPDRHPSTAANATLARALAQALGESPD